MKTYRAITITLSWILLGSLFLGSYTDVRAQTDSADTVTFAALGEQEILLSGPTDSTGIDFNFPADWKVTSGSVLHLNFRAYVGQISQDDAVASAAGYLNVYMNNTWLETVALTENGDYSIDIEIPDSAWKLVDTREPQSLRITMHDAVNCSLLWESAETGNWRSLNVAISPTSYVDLPHNKVDVPTDIRQLPYPLFQDTFLPDTALVIVPEYPTEGELQAAFIVEAALARMTDGNLTTSFTNVGDLTMADLEETHAIFVGRPSAFLQLDTAELSLKPVGGKFEAEQIKPEDGILQLVSSPVNPAKVWLIVSGNDDVGIVKAAQAVGGGRVRPYGPSNLSIITSVQPQPATAPSTDISLESLGYGEETYSAYGLVYFAYYFDVPPTQKVTDGAYFEMTYSNSALLNFEESGFSIMLNDQFVGSARLSDRTTELATAKFNILPNMFRAGKNLLLLEANLSGITPCIPVEEIWISVKPSSLLHLPYLPVSDSVVSGIDLTSYPQTLFPTTENLAFILTRDNPTTWEIAASIASQIGQNTRTPVLQPSVAYADAIPDGLLEGNSQVIIGRPSTIALIQELTPSLPAAFAAGTDVATESSSEFTFNVPENVPVGYLEILPSPWNKEKLILTVLGNSEEGLRSASQALADSTIRSQMNGNLAVIYDSQVIVDQVNLAANSPAGNLHVAVRSTPIVSADSQEGPFKLNFITIGLVVLVVIGIVALIALFAKPKKINSSS